jgi:ABC-type sugar transport system permease subunit
MTVFPALYLLRSSFFSFTLLSGESHFVGLQNYLYDLTNPDIRNSLLITLLFVVIAVGLELVIGLLLALALARQTLENTIASTLLLLPFAVTPVVSALLWRGGLLLAADRGYASADRLVRLPDHRLDSPHRIGRVAMDAFCGTHLDGWPSRNPSRPQRSGYR